MGWKISLKIGSPMPVEPACSISGSANHSPITGRCPRRKSCSDVSVIASTLRWISAGSSLVPERYGPATRIMSGATAGTIADTAAAPLRNLGDPDHRHRAADRSIWWKERQERHDAGHRFPGDPHAIAVDVFDLRDAAVGRPRLVLREREHVAGDRTGQRP